jgi:hypothetical protein
MMNRLQDEIGGHLPVRGTESPQDAGNRRRRAYPMDGVQQQQQEKVMPLSLPNPPE